jgi:hypothetical protein
MTTIPGHRESRITKSLSHLKRNTSLSLFLSLIRLSLLPLSFRPLSETLSVSLYPVTLLSSQNLWATTHPDPLAPASLSVTPL